MSIQRTPTTLSEIRTWVEQELDRLTTAGEEFTAWQVTNYIRANNPTREIVHADVQREVHMDMAVRINTGLAYDVQLRNYTNGDANTYFPRPAQDDDFGLDVTTPLPTDDDGNIDWDALIDGGQDA